MRLFLTCLFCAVSLLGTAYDKKEAAKKRYRQYLKQPAKTNDSTARRFVREWLKETDG